MRSIADRDRDRAGLRVRGPDPERRSALWAAFCSGSLALGLFVLWILGRARRREGQAISKSEVRGR